MPRLIPRVLSGSDLPLPELYAAKLDGEVYAVDESFAAIDEADGMLLRAAAIAGMAPDHAIVERESALWVYGIRSTPPMKHTLCVDVSDRIRAAPRGRWTMRECTMFPGDVIGVGRARMTSPLRTLVDIVRLSADFSVRERGELVELVHRGELHLEQCLARLRVQPRSPGTARAIDRLTKESRLFAPSAPPEVFRQPEPRRAAA